MIRCNVGRKIMKNIYDFGLFFFYSNCFRSFEMSIDRFKYLKSKKLYRQNCFFGLSFAPPPAKTKEKQKLNK